MAVQIYQAQNGDGVITAVPDCIILRLDAGRLKAVYHGYNGAPATMWTEIGRNNVQAEVGCINLKRTLAADKGADQWWFGDLPIEVAYIKAWVRSVAAGGNHSLIAWVEV